MSARDDTWVAVESGNSTRVCTVNVPEFCGQRATEVLHLRETPWSDWTESARCADHPAAGWLPMIRRAFPMAETRIEAIPQ